MSSFTRQNKTWTEAEKSLLLETESNILAAHRLGRTARSCANMRWELVQSGRQSVKVKHLRPSTVKALLSEDLKIPSSNTRNVAEVKVDVKENLPNTSANKMKFELEFNGKNLKLSNVPNKIVIDNNGITIM